MDRLGPVVFLHHDHIFRRGTIGPEQVGLRTRLKSHDHFFFGKIRYNWGNAACLHACDQAGICIVPSTSFPTWFPYRAAIMEEKQPLVLRQLLFVDIAMPS